MANVLVKLHNGTAVDPAGERLGLGPDHEWDNGGPGVEFEGGCYVEVPAGSIVYIAFKKNGLTLVPSVAAPAVP
jgi:hypothetical protein